MNKNGIESVEGEGGEGVKKGRGWIGARYKYLVRTYVKIHFNIVIFLILRKLSVHVNSFIRIFFRYEALIL